MEKKQNLRTNQLVSAKALTSDSRKTNQESSGKQLPRNLRRRDFTGNHNNCSSGNNNSNSSSNAYGAHYNGRNQMQLHQQQHIFAPKARGGGPDKRQSRPRHNGYQRSVGPAASTSHTGLDEYDERRCNDDGSEFEAELNSIYLPGSKKQNLNHLLNFNYAPRERHDSGTLMRSGNNANGHGYVKRIKYNKEQFLQANCQFVVNASGDYATHTLSPDSLVEWTCIEQIHMFGSTEEPQCPICLYHPVAAKMTRCGHVYCWPCILHYLALSDKKSWRKCPICYEAVHIGDLKSAVARPQRNYNCDDIATLQLMCRSKDSLQVTKVGDATTSNGNALFPCLSDDIAATINSKLVLAKPLDIMSIIERERNELKCQLTSDGIDCPDSVFVQQALHLLEEREKLIRIETIAGPVTVKNDAIEEGASALEKLSLNVDAKEFVPTFDDAASVSSDNDHFVINEETNLTIDDIDIVPNTARAANSKNFYFYQSSDGQNLYLHSVNVRMLQTMYGSLDAAPKSISGRILQKEVCSMSEDLRKRLKYLQHLPVSCQFEVVEIQLDGSIVSAEVLAKFKDELLMRQKSRERRAREERKREKHIDRVNKRQIGMMIRSTMSIDVTSDQQFPMCGGSFDDAPPILVAEPSTSVRSSSTSVTPVSASAGPSFAKMLTSAQTGIQTELWPTLAQPKEIPTAISTADFLPLRPCRPPAMAQHANLHAHEHSEDESIDYGQDFNAEACAPPEFKSSFGSAIAEALNKSAHVKPTENRNQVTNGRGKKKKNNGMVLFSTGGRTYDGN